eukprot:UC1_evm1s2056
MNSYQADFLHAITSYATFHRPGNGAFLYNCDLHCGEQNAVGFDNITVGSTIMRDALTAWWNADVSAPSGDHTYVESCTLKGPSACNPTCPARTL